MRHARSCSHRQLRLWSSVALPLGINRDERHAKDGRVYPKYPATSTLFQFDFTVGRPGGTATLDAERRVAGRPMGGVRPARPKGRKSCRVHFRPQPAENEDGASAEYFDPPHPGAAGRPLARGLSYFALGSKLGQEYSPTHRPNPSLMLGPARFENRNRFSNPKNCHSPKPGPVLRPVSASLRLRFRSAAFSRACTIQLFRLTAEMIESLLKARRASVPQEGTALRPRGPHVPWTGETAFRYGSLYPVLCPRAWGNLVKTCQHILTISLFRRGAQSRHCPE